ncbi:hypothetical protein [Mycobacteroides franklinii]|uniref:Uncharacterized protein n=1 Tax=Mycobacteroides franklinii TaxID=948102 RepID=A0A4R5P585_9MYCO|nr:hypothetical protein [Mycobacteroides franklinii]ORA59539.1 hypothetical protein BST24_17580 [Mycobacteroides franklinii]TDH18580.1 hypothetical protein EJ571_18320 [Mycobacteroides franklinii]TDZ46195.1 hypothetical protein CCUG64054_00009 [Mycobacteroides franklinii]TDZ53238.1 hypothetical protein CCUG63697_00277 [Mycobacteroides franklinii]TDZ59912.1 hypothetical protein CCUG63696_00011 [Mycobacteroides franklinii]
MTYREAATAARVPTRLLRDLAETFRPPRRWLEGLGLNLALSIAYLIIWQPIAQHGRKRDWALLVGMYFAMFIFADVSVTNMLGLDADRVRHALRGHRSLLHVLLVKNIALFLVAGLPTLMLTAVLTVHRQQATQTAITVPDVAVHIVSWLGLGNLVSVLLPMAAQPLRERWRQRGDLLATVRWLVYLALPYGVYYLVAPVGGIPRAIFGRNVFHSMPLTERSLLELGLGIAVWTVGTALALGVHRYRGLRWH